MRGQVINIDFDDEAARKRNSKTPMPNFRHGMAII
jgi:hypothetical protein